MQNLHCNLTTRFVHPVGHDAVVINVFLRCHHRGPMRHTAFGVWPDAPCHHQRNIASGAGGVEFCNTVPVLGFFQSRVHRPHQNPVFQLREPQIQWGKQVRVV